MFHSLASLALLVIVPKAFAIGVPTTVCGGLIGCGAGAANVLWTAIINPNAGIAIVMLRLCAALAVLYIMFAGVQMVISLGDEGKITQQKWGMAYAMIGLCVSILSQFIISGVGSIVLTGGPGDLPFNVLMNAGIILRTVLNGLLLMMIAIASLRMLYAQGKADDYNTGKKMLYWGLAGAVIVNFAAALILAVAQYFGVAG
jgi:hypothetical protein